MVLSFSAWFLFIVLLTHTLVTLGMTQLALINIPAWQMTQSICTMLLKLGLMVYAITAIHCLSRRKRKINDVSVTCWFMALCCLFLCCAISLVMNVMMNTMTGAESLLLSLGWSPLTLASVFIYGWIVSVIMAMIIKIIPFWHICTCNVNVDFICKRFHCYLICTNY